MRVGTVIVAARAALHPSQVLVLREGWGKITSTYYHVCIKSVLSQG